jgi:hypothetical protein
MTSNRALTVVEELDEIGLPRDRWGDLTVTGRPRCKGIKLDGTRCGAFRNPRNGFCYQHDPNVTYEARQATLKRAGQGNTRAARAQRMLPPRLRAVFDRLETAMVDVIDGTLSPTRASALAALSSASVRVLVAGELEEEVRRLRSMVGDDADWDPPPTLQLDE